MVTLSHYSFIQQIFLEILTCGYHFMVFRVSLETHESLDEVQVASPAL